MTRSHWLGLLIMIPLVLIVGDISLLFTSAGLINLTLGVLIGSLILKAFGRD